MGISWWQHPSRWIPLTHQVDFSLMREIVRFCGKIYCCWHYQGCKPLKRRYCPSCFTAEALNVPMIFAKKAKNITMNEGILTAEVYPLPSKWPAPFLSLENSSHQRTRSWLSTISFANGQAAKGLIQIIEQAGATVEAIGIVDWKIFPRWPWFVWKAGYPVLSPRSFRSFWKWSSRI